MFQTSVQEEQKAGWWSVLGGVGTFVFLIAGGYLMLIR